MFANYLKVALRNIKKYKAYSFINIVGLAVGMTCCILILLYVRAELSFDKYHDNHKQIYRVTRQWFNEDGVVNLHLGHVAPPVGPLLKNDFPDIIHSVRLFNLGRPLLNYAGKYFEEDRFFFAEKDVFQVFTFPLLQGDPASALLDPFAVVVSESVAQRYFGEQSPMGETMTFEIDGRKGDLKVTGVMEDILFNSHFHADFFVSFTTFERYVGKRAMEDWSSNNYATYLLMPEEYDITLLKAQLDPFVDRHMSEGRSLTTKLKLQKLTDIHLHSHLDSEIEANGNITFVYMFSLIALFILLIACINFMNLATARSAGRAREVGLRKVVGAERGQLIRQFLSESIILSVVSLLIAVLLSRLLLPIFNGFVQRELPLDFYADPVILIGLFLIAGLVGFLSGIYPAVFLSAFQPVKVLKGYLESNSRGLSFRTILVVFQFAISITLIISVGMVSRQLNYMQDKELGFDKEQIVVLPSSPVIARNLESTKELLKQHSGVLEVSAAKRVPSGRLLDSAGARVIRGEESERISFRIAMLRVDADYIPTFGMELAAGRNFSKEMPTDRQEAFILNETAVQRIGWESSQAAINQQFGYGRQNGRIIGVVKDFHFESLHQEIAPIVLLYSSFSLNQISLKLRGSDIPGTMAFLQEKWEQYRPNRPFSYYFIDENFDQQYRSEQNLRRTFSAFAFLAIVIACLGLFGLASYTAEQRTREVGIRKVLGASVPGIVVLFSKDFSRWVLLANLISFPLAYWAMNKWLQNFAYRAVIPWWLFVLAGLSALGIALLTVGYQSLKAALADPVKAIKYE